MYQDELKAIKKRSKYRARSIYDDRVLDLASNDYLGFSEDKEILDRAYRRLRLYKTHSPKASQLINGYHPIHKEFEEYLKQRDGFEDALVVGSGFLANLSLIEALPRRGDLLILDEEYHASGILASKLPKAKVEYFRHNDADHLMEILKSSIYKRSIVAVEGVYSMGGDLVSRDIFGVADEFNSLLIVDEAHSSGVIGDRFIGIFDHYKIDIKPNYIKMGTLGKAFGSYGAYILSSGEIVEFLLNRSKAIIYATAPSLFDIALAHEAMMKLEREIDFFSKKRDDVLSIAGEIFKSTPNSLILPIKISDNKRVLEIKDRLLADDILVAAIRPPTVKSAILRVILRLNIKIDTLKEALDQIGEMV